MFVISLNFDCVCVFFILLFQTSSALSSLKKIYIEMTFSKEYILLIHERVEESETPYNKELLEPVLPQ